MHYTIYLILYSICKSQHKSENPPCQCMQLVYSSENICSSSFSLLLYIQDIPATYATPVTTTNIIPPPRHQNFHQFHLFLLEGTENKIEYMPCVHTYMCTMIAQCHLLAVVYIRHTIYLPNMLVSWRYTIYHLATLAYMQCNTANDILTCMIRMAHGEYNLILKFIFIRIRFLGGRFNSYTYFLPVSTKQKEPITQVAINSASLYKSRFARVMV